MLSKRVKIKRVLRSDLRLALGSVLTNQTSSSHQPKMGTYLIRRPGLVLRRRVSVLEISISRILPLAAGTTWLRQRV